MERKMCVVFSLDDLARRLIEQIPRPRILFGSHAPNFSTARRLDPLVEHLGKKPARLTQTKSARERLSAGKHGRSAIARGSAPEKIVRHWTIMQKPNGRLRVSFRFFSACGGTSIRKRDGHSSWVGRPVALASVNALVLGPGSGSSKKVSNKKSAKPSVDNACRSEREAEVLNPTVGHSRRAAA